MERSMRAENNGGSVFGRDRQIQNSTVDISIGCALASPANNQECEQRHDEQQGVRESVDPEAGRR